MATTSIAVEVKKVIGTDEAIKIVEALVGHLSAVDAIAMEALKVGDRKGVLLAMRVSAAIERSKKSIMKSVERANKVRGKKADEADESDDDDDDNDE